MLGREHGPKASSLILKLGNPLLLNCSIHRSRIFIQVPRSNVVPIKPPAKLAPKEPSSKIEENTDSIESAIQLKISLAISKRRPRLIVIIPEAARNPKNENLQRLFSSLSMIY